MKYGACGATVTAGGVGSAPCAPEVEFAGQKTPQPAYLLHNAALMSRPLAYTESKLLQALALFVWLVRLCNIAAHQRVSSPPISCSASLMASMQTSASTACAASLREPMLVSLYLRWAALRLRGLGRVKPDPLLLGLSPRLRLVRPRAPAGCW